MKFTRLFAAVIAAAMVFCCFAACSHDVKKPDDAVYYTVTFDLDGGVVPGQDLLQGLKVLSGTKLRLENYKPEKTNYTFKGWLSGETEYAANAEITVNADIALTALWEIIPVEKFTVTFDPAGGTLNGSAERLSLQAEKNTALDFSQYVPEKDEYTFKGWKSGETLYTGGTYTVTSATDFVAVWAKTLSADENFVFEETTEKDGYILKGLTANSTITEIVVPGYYQNKPVLKIANNVFAYKDDITAVDLSNCDKLEEIGDWNFSSCGALASVNLEGCSSLKKIGDSCFQGNSIAEINLKSLAALEEIGSNCFRGDFGSSQSDLPVEILDFTDCVSLKTIGQMSFWHLTKLKELDFSKTQLQTFARQTIHLSPALEILKLPKTLKLTHEGSDGTLVTTEFCSNCENLKEIILDPLNIFMTVENGALMDADETVIYKYAVKCEGAKFTAPATVTTVMNRAFYKATNLTEIDFSATKLTEIKNSAFAGCTNALLKVPFGEDGTYADKSAACILGSNWNDGVKEIQYGEAAKIFKFTTDLVDGKSVTEASFTFTASAEYGTSLSLSPCTLTVKCNGSEITGDNGNYTVTLQDGENTIELIASSGDDTETKTYKVNKVGKAELKTDLADGEKGGNYSFKVWAENSDGTKLDISGYTLSLTFAWEKKNPQPGDFKSLDFDDCITITYDTENNYFLVNINYEDIYYVHYYMYDSYAIQIQLNGLDWSPIVKMLSYTG